MWCIMLILIYVKPFLTLAQSVCYVLFQNNSVDYSIISPSINIVQTFSNIMYGFKFCNTKLRIKQDLMSVSQAFPTATIEKDQILLFPKYNVDALEIRKYEYTNNNIGKLFFNNLLINNMLLRPLLLKFKSPSSKIVFLHTINILLYTNNISDIKTFFNYFSDGQIQLTTLYKHDYFFSDFLYTIDRFNSYELFDFFSIDIHIKYKSNILISVLKLLSKRIIIATNILVNDNSIISIGRTNQFGIYNNKPFTIFTLTPFSFFYGVFGIAIVLCGIYQFKLALALKDKSHLIKLLLQQFTFTNNPIFIHNISSKYYYPIPLSLIFTVILLFVLNLIIVLIIKRYKRYRRHTVDTIIFPNL